jgi:signal transduction histidine kinase
VDRGILWNGHLGRRLWLGEALALVGIALGVAWSWIRLRRSRAAVARLVVELAQSPPPGGLRDVLARIVDDPELELAYPLDESDRLVDVRGVTVAFAAGKEQTRLIGDGRPLAVLGHAAGSLDDEQLVGEVASAARLALENERLQAQVHARVDQLRRSRSRIVEAGDAERVRLERDLHDGAQQRLVGLALSLRLLRSRLAEGVAQDVSAQLEVAEAELHAAIEDLRRLAHGIFPAVLADGGLRAALIALAEEAPVPIQIEDLDPGRYARRLEAAAYTVIAETARAADGGLAVRTTRSNGALVLEIDAHGVGAGLDRTELEDRVGAAEGRLAVEGRNGDLSIRADFPCAL